MGEGASHFLFEGQEKSGGQNKGGEPEGHDGFEVFFAEGLLADLKKGVTRDACHQQTSADRQRPLGERNAGRRGRLGSDGLVIGSQDLSPYSDQAFDSRIPVFIKSVT